MKRVVLGVFMLAAPLPASAQPHPPDRKPEEIGSWIVGCPNDDKLSCRLRHRVWLMPPAGTRPFAALEVQPRHGVLVPVLAVHGVTIPDAAGAVLALGTEASIQFGADSAIRLPCGFARDTISCAPARLDAAAASAQLRQSRTAVLRLHLAALANPAPPVPDLVRSLGLTRTADAMNRIQPAGEAADTRWDLRDLLDRGLRQLGFAGGVEEFLRWLLGRAAA